MTISLEKRLHHRKPYLLIDDILSHNNKEILALKTPSAEEFYMQGHFPGARIVPGAMMQEMTTQAAGALIAEYYSPVPDYNSAQTKGYALGVLRSVNAAKFKRFARPGDKLEIHVRLVDITDNLFRFKGTIKHNEDKIMQNEFVLMNISDSALFSKASHVHI